MQWPLVQWPLVAEPEGAALQGLRGSSDVWKTSKNLERAKGARSAGSRALAYSSKVTMALQLAQARTAAQAGEFDWSAKFCHDASLVELCAGYPEEALGISLLYEIVLGRQPDPSGMRSYLSKAIAGRSLKVIAGDLLGSEEYRSRGLGADWWRTACRQVGAREVAPAWYCSRAAYCCKLALQPEVRFRALQGIGCNAVLRRRYKELQDDAASRFRHATRSAEASRDAPLISILLPVYRAPVAYLESALTSVVDQTFPNWELCVVDDGSCSPEIEATLRSYQRADRRVKLLLSPENVGISRATNLALDMATGEYLCLLDHDDKLTLDAIEHVTAALAGGAPDALYSDECKLDEHDNVHDIFCKPDWDPTLLQNFMYTGHLSVYRTQLVRDLGGFRPEFDFSQDYDLVLRVAERTDRVAHIPRVLYGWRMIAGSAAAGGKSYARASNIAALQSSLDRRGMDGKAVAQPTVNQVVRASGAAPACNVAIVVPSDDLDNIRSAVASIRDHTAYSRYEIVVVANSRCIETAQQEPELARGARFVPYDLKFNFSDKCNVGAAAAAADADLLIFFNDDVRVTEGHWIERLLDVFIDRNVGAVGPKLLYENGTIQHAGMIAGVRRLLGTAFHCLPSKTAAHFNFAQAVRQVSIICGACLAIRRNVFDTVGGFDALRYPIAHSDVDLCFKVRDAGYRCVYTPHAELLHIGHVSIAKAEKAESGGVRPKDKASINLLEQWLDFTAYDPFFTPAMASVLYHDSPPLFRIYPALARGGAKSGGRDFLLAFHDFSNSGAPRALVAIASVLRKAGHFVVATGPCYGPYVEVLRKAGITVIVDEMLFSQSESVAEFCRSFDAVVANTVVAWPLVHQCAGQVDCYWYIHETGLIETSVSQDERAGAAFGMAKEVWVAGMKGEAAAAPYRRDVRIVEYGFPVARAGGLGRSGGSAGTTIVSVIGSVEPRKGQDLALRAVELLARRGGEPVELHFFGRTLDRKFHERLLHDAAGRPNIVLHGEVSSDRALDAVANSDIVLIPSRDEPFSIVGLDALAMARICVCGPEVGLFDYLVDGSSGFLAKSCAPEDLADALARALAKRAEWGDIGRAAQKLYESRFSAAAFEDRVLRRLGLETSL
jgi:GT2 family glycosyltransferase